MYADYGIWGGGLGGLVDDFLTVGVGSQNRNGQIFREWESDSAI